MSWYVRNVRDVEWWDRGPRGSVASLVESDEDQVGANLFVLWPGQPMSMYHWETDQEDFLVLSGEALLIVEDEERPLHAWDFFHCPPNVPHTIVGAGSGPSAILAIGAREHQDSPDWGGYPLSDVAMKHDAASPEATNDPKVAYGRFPPQRPGEFSAEWLPS
jgi:uncharacterized cupin superfamily protein